MFLISIFLKFHVIFICFLPRCIIVYLVWFGVITLDAVFFIPFIKFMENYMKKHLFIAALSVHITLLSFHSGGMREISAPTWNDIFDNRLATNYVQNSRDIISALEDLGSDRAATLRTEFDRILVAAGTNRLQQADPNRNEALSIINAINAEIRNVQARQQAEAQRAQQQTEAPRAQRQPDNVRAPVVDVGDIPAPVAVVMPPHDNHRPGGGGAAAVHVDNNPWITLGLADRDNLIRGMQGYIQQVHNLRRNTLTSQQLEEQVELSLGNDGLNLNPRDAQNIGNLVRLCLNANNNANNDDDSNFGRIWNQLSENIRSFFLNVAGIQVAVNTEAEIQEETRPNDFELAVKEFEELIRNPEKNNGVSLDASYLKKNKDESYEDFGERIRQTIINISKLERDGTWKGFPIFTLGKLGYIISLHYENLTPDEKIQLKLYKDNVRDFWRYALQCYFLDFRNTQNILNLLDALKRYPENNRLAQFLSDNSRDNQNYFDENLQPLHQDFILQLLLGTQKTDIFGEYAAFLQEIFKNFEKILGDIVLDESQKANPATDETQEKIKTATENLTRRMSQKKLDDLFASAEVMQFVYSHLVENNGNQPFNDNPMAFTEALIKMPPLMILRMLSNWDDFKNFCKILSVLNDRPIDASTEWANAINDLHKNNLARQICAILGIQDTQEEFWTNQIQKFKDSNSESHANDSEFWGAQIMRLALCIYEYLEKCDQVRMLINIQAQSEAMANIEKVAKEMEKYELISNNFQDNYTLFFETEKKNEIMNALEGLGKETSKDGKVFKSYEVNLGTALTAASDMGIIQGIRDFETINTILSKIFELYFQDFVSTDDRVDEDLQNFINLIISHTILGCVNPFAIAEIAESIDNTLSQTMKNVGGGHLGNLPIDLLRFIFGKCAILDYDSTKVSNWVDALPTKDLNEIKNIVTNFKTVFENEENEEAKIGKLKNIFLEFASIFNNQSLLKRIILFQKEKEALNKLFQYIVNQSIVDEGNNEENDEGELMSLSDIAYENNNGFRYFSNNHRPDAKTTDGALNAISDNLFWGIMSIIPNDLMELKLIRFYTDVFSVGQYVIPRESFIQFCKLNPDRAKDAYLMAMFVNMLENSRFFSAFDAIAQNSSSTVFDMAINFDNFLWRLVKNNFAKDYIPICSHEMQIVFPEEKIIGTALEKWSKYSLDALNRFKEDGSTTICSRKDGSEIGKFDEDMIVNFAVSLWELIVLGGDIKLVNGVPSRPQQFTELRIDEKPAKQWIADAIKNNYSTEEAQTVLWSFLESKCGQSPLISTMIMCDGDAAAAITYNNDILDFAEHTLMSIEKLRSAYQLSGSIQFVQIPVIVRYLLPNFINLVRFSRDYFEPNQIFFGMLETLSTWNGYFIEGLHHCGAGQFDALVKIFGQYLNASSINDFLIHIVGKILNTDEEQQSNVRQKISEILLSGRNELNQQDFYNVVPVNNDQLEQINKILEPAIAIKWDSEDGIKLVFTLISNSLASSIFGEINDEFSAKYNRDSSEQAMYIACMTHHLLGWAGTMYQKGIGGWAMPVAGFIELIQKYSATLSDQQCAQLCKFYSDIFQKDEQNKGQRFIVKEEYFDFESFTDLTEACYMYGATRALDSNETHRRNKLLGIMNALYSVVVCHSIAKDYTAAAEVIVNRFCRDHSNYAAKLGLTLLSFKQLCLDPANNNEGLAKQAQVLQDILMISTVIGDSVLGGYFRASPEDELVIKQKLGLL